MTFVYGRGWVYQEKTDGDGADGAGGAPAGGDGGTADGDAGGDKSADAAGADAGDLPDEPGAKKEGAAGEPKVEAPKDMKAAIDAALGYDKEAKAKADLAAAEKKKTEETAALVKAAGSHANGTPKKNEKGQDLDDKGQVVKAAPSAPAKLKTSAELDLKAEQLKLLKPETQARFREVIGTLKQREEAFTQLETQHKAVVGARDTLFKVFEEARMSKEALGHYCLFNDYFTSGDPVKLEQALSMINAQRVEILKFLGREEAGVDLLKEHPDLAKQVEDEEITRAAALELAKGRRERAARADQQQRAQAQQQQKTQTVENFKKESDKALGEIQAWAAGLAKSDLDYKAKEDKLVPLMEGEESVLHKYPPHLWLSTLKMLYQGIEVTKAAPTLGQKQPLRPSGAKPGGRAPATMEEAISQGLGYVVAAKG